MFTDFQKFFLNIINKTSLANNTDFTKADYLEDICTFFDVSNGFVYEINNHGNFSKTHFYTAHFATPFDNEIDLKNILGYELLSKLSSEKIICSSGDDERGDLEIKLHSIFNSNALILIPVLNQHYELSAFVGIVDRRKNIRKDNLDIKTACSIVTLLADKVKLDIFQRNTNNAELILHQVLDNVNIDIYVNDYYTHDMLYVNKSMAAPYGGVENMMGKKCWQAIFTDKLGQCDFCPQHKILDEDNNPTKAYTWDYERKLDGNWFRVFSSCIPWTDGRLGHLVASVDITENKKNQMLIEKLAKFDHLTGLPNRRSLDDQLDLFINDKTLFSSEFFVLFCDLDGFKKVNDTLGHNGGDALLKAISYELSSLVDKTFRAYRQGGDEFVVLIKDFNNSNYLKDTLEKLFTIFCNTYHFEGKEMKCGCSIGVAHYPNNATTKKDLFHMADAAMYSAKKSGKGTVHFYKKDKFITLNDYIKLNY